MKGSRITLEVWAATGDADPLNHGKELAGKAAAHDAGILLGTGWSFGCSTPVPASCYSGPGRAVKDGPS